jgi:hypothetical protein
MSRNTEGQIPLDLYDELHDRMFPSDRPTPPYLGGSQVQEYRRADIEDSFARFSGRLKELFPDIDAERFVRLVANMAFVERSGFEDGVAAGAASQEEADRTEIQRMGMLQMRMQELTV